MQASVDRLERVSEGSVNSIAAHFHNLAAIALHGSSGDRVVTRQCLSHRLGSFFP
jgi:hypothetical protein